jgi:CheY-like chemotaxis protein
VASILIVGSDPALLEGVSQTLAGAGHQVTLAHDVTEAVENLNGLRPLVALVNKDHLVAGAGGFAIPLARGGAMMTYRASDDEPRNVPFSVQRATLAELQLPLERQRLLALVKCVEERARTCGKTPEEGELLEEAPRR